MMDTRSISMIKWILWMIWRWWDDKKEDGRFPSSESLNFIYYKEYKGGKQRPQQEIVYENEDKERERKRKKGRF